jgi:hypothetical protein
VWLTQAAAAGAGRVRRKMAEAVDLAKPHGHDPVDDALRIAADAGRFGEGARVPRPSPAVELPAPMALQRHDGGS